MPATFWGQSFVLRDSLMAITLSNLNPQSRLGIALCNLTLIEKGEVWIQVDKVTPAVGRLLEALDGESLAIARDLNVKTRDIFEHFSRSFLVPPGRVAEMSAAMVKKRPARAWSDRCPDPVCAGSCALWVSPDCVAWQNAWGSGKVACGGINLFNALYGRDFFAENELMNELKAK